MGVVFNVELNVSTDKVGTCKEGDCGEGGV